MAKYASTFILLNVGSEMLYVVSQRLKAQNISHERSTHDEITASLINQRLIADLLNDQKLISCEEMKDLVDNVAQSSIMRLDATSMDRLWDLITMVFKWQMTLARDTFLVTIRHLYEIETFVTNPATQLSLHRVQNMVDNFAKILTDGEKHDLFDCITHWLRDFDVRVSLLMRLGFQHADATFKMGGFDPAYATMLDNLGENVYAAAKHFNLQTSATRTTQNVKHELDTVYDQLLGAANTVGTEATAFFKLSLGDTFDAVDISHGNCDTGAYSHINVQSTNSFDVFDVVHAQDNASIHEELLNMLDESL